MINVTAVATAMEGVMKFDENHVAAAAFCLLLIAIIAIGIVLEMVW